MLRSINGRCITVDSGTGGTVLSGCVPVRSSEMTTHETAPTRALSETSQQSAPGVRQRRDQTHRLAPPGAGGAVERLVVEREADIAEGDREGPRTQRLRLLVRRIVGLKGEIAGSAEPAQMDEAQEAQCPAGQQPASAWVQYEPLGVALIIGPWNCRCC